MLRIDEAIKETDKVICKNIERFDKTERGLLSQNVLSQLRNFVEYIAQKIYSLNQDIDPNNYENKKEAIKYISSHGQYRFIYKFHSLLQKSVSHYTIEESGSERLMLKYYEYLIRLKNFMHSNYGITILHNIDKFPLNCDKKLSEYYEKISNCLDHPKKSYKTLRYDDRVYIEKIKPFFVNQKVYYEVTYTPAIDKVSKFDRTIAFTKFEILPNYAADFHIVKDNIEIMGKQLPIQIIDSWAVSIRPCELKNFSKILGLESDYSAGTIEYKNLMRYLTDERADLVELVNLDDENYNKQISRLTANTRSNHIFTLIERCRTIIANKCNGANVLLYLLYTMNNRIIKLQYSEESCCKLSDLHLAWGCIPFDQMPFSTSLIKHNPKLSYLLECIDSSGREHELLARAITINTEQKGMLFTAKNELTCFENIEELIEKYNKKLYSKHQSRRLREYKNYVYIENAADNCAKIIEEIVELSKTGIGGYTNSVKSWLNATGYKIDSDEKLLAVQECFSESRVALIYGAAGTGKSTLIKHISNFFSERDKIYLANTNPAVDNLKRKVKVPNCDFKTITKFLLQNNYHFNCDILIIDECSTVSNKDMIDILNRATFKLLVLVGDVYQIESILFGNWFSLVRYFIPQKSVTILKNPYRSKSKDLLTLWNSVRALDEAILESVVKSKFYADMDDTIFIRNCEDEIILCLNYDGLYGINNINRFLQNNNKNEAVEWGINTYKVGDPILFNETERFAPIIYNNMKGKIVKIEKEEKRIKFDVELDIAINEMDALYYSFEWIGNTPDGKSIISFWVNKYKNSDNEDDSMDAIMPFQIAYAISIHKAQGLEYKSVKVIITNEIEELISHNIFYTAITRAKEMLKIYWSPETEQKILNSLSLKNYSKDAHLLSSLKNIKIVQEVKDF